MTQRRKGVADASSFAARGDQPGVAEHARVLARRSEAGSGPPGQFRGGARPFECLQDRGSRGAQQRAQCVRPIREIRAGEVEVQTAFGRVDQDRLQIGVDQADRCVPAKE